MWISMNESHCKNVQNRIYTRWMSNSSYLPSTFHRQAYQAQVVKWFDGLNHLHLPTSPQPPQTTSSPAQVHDLESGVGKDRSLTSAHLSAVTRASITHPFPLSPSPHTFIINPRFSFVSSIIHLLNPASLLPFPRIIHLHPLCLYLSSPWAFLTLNLCRCCPTWMASLPSLSSSRPFCLFSSSFFFSNFIPLDFHPWSLLLLS